MAAVRTLSNDHLDHPFRGTAMIRGGGLERAYAAGMADDTTEITVDTRFQAASVSKQFAACAALLLVEAGELRLRESVRRWLPVLPAPWDGVTLHHLLSHTSGLRHWDPDQSGLDPSVPMDLEQRMELIARTPLSAPPGEAWCYSSPGYLMVGRLVELATAMPYHRFLTERILIPAELSSTTAGEGGAGSVAAGFRSGAAVPPWDLAGFPGTGDLLSTVGDLVRFTEQLHGGALLSTASVRAMTTIQARTADRGTPHQGPPDQGAPDQGAPDQGAPDQGAPDQGAPDQGAPDQGAPDQDALRVLGYGYGQFIGGVGADAIFFHPGDNPGYRAFSAWVPDRGTSLAILSNDEDTDVEEVARHLLRQQ